MNTDDYIINMAAAAVKLRKARDADTDATLTASEVKALCQGLLYLAQAPQ